MELDNQDLRNIVAELSAINSRLSRIEEAQRHPSPTCSVHGEKLRALDERIGSVEAQQGKHNIIAVTAILGLTGRDNEILRRNAVVVCVAWVVITVVTLKVLT
jgi:hypothetical protein